jgi:hypothetical protein
MNKTGMILKQSQIDHVIHQHKVWYESNFPLCGFCFHRVKEGKGQLAHIVRRSYSRELQTYKLNTVLAHPDCHSLYDDSPEQAVYLPRIIEILYIAYLLDPDYFNLIANNFVAINDVLQLFPSVEYREIEHHGQILQLNYLYK